MEELRAYLNQVFGNVPETPEMLRAKSELLQMMEDKYEGLIDDGMDEQEAINTVIEEFGDFDEVGSELGVDDVIRDNATYEATGTDTSADATASESADQTAYTDTAQTGAEQTGYDSSYSGDAAQAGYNGAYAGGAAQTGYENNNYYAGGAQNGYDNNNYYAGGAQNGYMGPNPEDQKTYQSMTMNGEQLESYVRFSKSHAFKVGAGVACCILAPYVAAVFSDVFESFIGDVADALSTLGFFGCIALAVAFFITAASQFKAGTKLKGKALVLDESAENILRTKINNTSTTGLLVVGIILCVMGPAVSAIGDTLPPILSEIFEPGVLLCAAIGVFFIIYSSSVNERMKSLSKAIKRSGKPGVVQGPDGPTEWTYEPKKGMPVWAIVLIVVLVGGGIGVITTTALGLNRVFFWPFSHIAGGSGETYDLVEEFNASTVDGIFADLSLGNLEIKAGDTDKIVCKANGTFRGRPKITQKGSLISIEEKSSGGLGIGGGQYTIFIPKNKSVECEIDMAAGDTKIEQVSLGKAHIDMTAGNLDINTCKVDDVLELDLTAGNVNIDNTEVKRVEADLTAGDFRYHFADRSKADAFSFDLDAGFGDINLLGQNFSDEVEVESKSGSGEKMEVDVSAGSITID